MITTTRKRLRLQPTLHKLHQEQVRVLALAMSQSKE